MAPMNILFMPLEFPNWATAKPQSYTATFGIEEGMRGCGVETLTVPVYPPGHLFGREWQDRIISIAEGSAFDQAWLGLVHARYSPAFAEWLKGIPVRVGMLFESMAYTQSECEELPALAGREEHVIRQVRSLGLTHVLCADERDADVIEAQGLAKGIWFPAAIPARHVAQAHILAVQNRCVFFGDMYSRERRALADHLDFHNLLERPAPPESATNLPLTFDELHVRTLHELQAGKLDVRKVYSRHVKELRHLREELFKTWMQALPQWCGSLNFPSYFKGYSGRVIEAIGANVPVVTWAVPERPKNKALFKDGQEVLLFPRERQDILVEHLVILQKKPDLRCLLADAARAKAMAYHTSEKRVAQILAWIKHEIVPDLGG